jgi:hypothetical protein
MPTIRPRWKYSADSAIMAIKSPNDGSNMLSLSLDALHPWLYCLMTQRGIFRYLDNETVTILRHRCDHRCPDQARYLGRPYRLPETTKVPSFSK